MATERILSRGFVLNFSAQFTFSLVFTILLPAIPIYLSGFKAREAEIGFLIGVFSVSSLVLRPFVGRALLRNAEKTFMVAGSLLYAVSCLAYLVAPPFFPLLFVRIIHGVGIALFTTASFTLLATTAPEAHRSRLVSYFFLANNLAFALGPYFGMLLINHCSFVALFLVCAGVSVCALFIASRLPGRVAPDPKTAAPKPSPMLSPVALRPALVAFMLNTVWGSLSAFFPLFALQHGVSNPGIFFLFLALTLILGRAFGGRILDLYGKERVIGPCLGTIALALLVLTFSNGLPMFILSALILGSGWALIFPSLMLCAIEEAGDALGPAMGTFTALCDLGGGVGPMIMGVILQYSNYPVMFVSLTLITAFNLAFAYRFLVKRAPMAGNAGG
jgi:MFS family permease